MSIGGNAAAGSSIIAARSRHHLERAAAAAAKCLHAFSLSNDSSVASLRYSIGERLPPCPAILPSNWSAVWPLHCLFHCTADQAGQAGFLAARSSKIIEGEKLHRALVAVVGGGICAAGVAHFCACGMADNAHFTCRASARRCAVLLFAPGAIFSSSPAWPVHRAIMADKERPGAVRAAYCRQWASSPILYIGASPLIVMAYLARGSATGILKQFFKPCNNHQPK